MNNKVHSAKLLHHKHVGVSFDVCDNVLSLLKAFLPNKICMYVRQPTKTALTYNVSVNNWLLDAQCVQKIKELALGVLRSVSLKQGGPVQVFLTEQVKKKKHKEIKYELCTPSLQITPILLLNSLVNLCTTI